MAKLKVQAQHLKAGDIVGSGEKVVAVCSTGLDLPKGKSIVKLVKYANSDHEYFRTVLWGKYTLIGVERGDG